MDDQQKFAFQRALDVVKQFITLATGILVLSVGVVFDFADRTLPVSRGMIIASWLLFLLSVTSGIVSMMVMTNAAGRESASIDDLNIRRPVVVQILSFYVGLVIVAILGIMLLVNSAA